VSQSADVSSQSAVTCGNCGSPLSGPYCSQCGEKKLTRKDYSLPHFAEEALGVFTHLDTKFLRTLKVLLAKPGELSNAYFHGGRSRYTKPLTLFVIINIVFFIVQPHTGLLRYKYRQYLNNPHYLALVRNHLLQTREAEQTYAARFNTNLQNQKKSLLIVSVPVLALVMAVLFIGTRRTYAEHLVFSVQVYTFLLIFLAAMVLVMTLLLLILSPLGPAAVPVTRGLQTEAAISTMTLTGLTVYIYFGLRRAYDASRLRAALAAFILAWTVALLTGVYRNLNFYATFWAT
jgi:hypothetical protein